MSHFPFDIRGGVWLTCPRSVRPLKEVAEQQENRNAAFRCPFTSPQRTTLPARSLFQRERAFLFTHPTHGCPTVNHIGRLRKVRSAGGLSVALTTGKSLGSSGERFVGMSWKSIRRLLLNGMSAIPVNQGYVALKKQKRIMRILTHPASEAWMRATVDKETIRLSLMVNTYSEFLGSTFWAGIREVKISRNPVCERCRSHLHLQVHHKFYRASWYDTQISDLETLCRKCHKCERFIKDPPKKYVDGIKISPHPFEGSGNDFNCLKCGAARALHPLIKNKSKRIKHTMTKKQASILRQQKHKAELIKELRMNLRS